MKKIFVVIIGIVLLGGGLFLISKKSSKLVSSPTAEQPEKAISPQKTAALFNTNDNLDQAIQDLDQIE